MIQDFKFYFNEGWKHLINWDALDHQLFLLILILPFLFKDYKKIIWLISAFTIGHSITLALTILQYITPDTYWVELVIPITIMLNALILIFNSFKKNKYFAPIHFVIILIFGLVHGMGYANGLQFIIASDQSIVFCLFSFNIGLEIAQLVLLLFFLPILSFLYRSSKKIHSITIILLSILVFLLALKIFIERI